MALFVVGGVIKLNKLTWLLWQTCTAGEKQKAVTMREERKPKESERERERGRVRDEGDSEEQEGKQEMNEDLIELHGKKRGLLFVCFF